MGKALRFLLSALSVATGGLFIYSAYTKLFPTIQAFEYTIASQVHIPYLTAAIAARFFIGLEGGLGILMVLHFFGRGKWVLKGAFALLVVFSIYLIWLWASAGNNVNCGCFGDAIWMSPSASLVKNAVLLVLIGALIRYHRGFDTTWANTIPAVHLICALTLPYLMYPVFTHYKLSFKAMYADTAIAPKTDLTKGRYIIAFVSPSCTHCRKAALKMHNMKVNNPTIPFYMIVGGTDTFLHAFWRDSHAQDLPYSRMADSTFMTYTGGEFPQIIWVNNGWVEANTTYPELDQKTIEDWMKETAPTP